MGCEKPILQVIHKVELTLHLIPPLPPPPHPTNNTTMNSLPPWTVCRLSLMLEVLDWRLCRALALESYFGGLRYTSTKGSTNNWPLSGNWHPLIRVHSHLFWFWHVLSMWAARCTAWHCTNCTILLGKWCFGFNYWCAHVACALHFHNSWSIATSRPQYLCILPLIACHHCMQWRADSSTHIYVWCALRACSVVLTVFHSSILPNVLHLAHGRTCVSACFHSCFANWMSSKKLEWHMLYDQPFRFRCWAGFDNNDLL